MLAAHRFYYVVEEFDSRASCFDQHRSLLNKYRLNTDYDNQNLYVIESNHTLYGYLVFVLLLLLQNLVELIGRLDLI